MPRNPKILKTLKAHFNLHACMGIAIDYMHLDIFVKNNKLPFVHSHKIPLQS